MNALHDDPWESRLSEHLDGDLAPDERAELERHLARCESCGRALAELERVKQAARELRASSELHVSRELGDRAPDRDLWPGIAARIGRSGPSRATRTARRAIGLAATILLAALFGWSIASHGSDGETTDARPRFVLLLHEPAGLGAGSSADEIARVVDEYRSWGQSVARSGRLVGGEKLADREGFTLRADGASPRGDVEGVGGYFLIRASTYDEALEIARGCPHLRHGGWIEVRRIEET